MGAEANGLHAGCVYATFIEIFGHAITKFGPFALEIEVLVDPEVLQRPVDSGANARRQIVRGQDFAAGLFPVDSQPVFNRIPAGIKPKACLAR